MKHEKMIEQWSSKSQPPSGGCVLKPPILSFLCLLAAAAFRRLCVETAGSVRAVGAMPPAAFRRLCVETERYQDAGRYR